jgi:hypothetical protein
MEKTQRDGCSERLGPYSVFKHTGKEILREKGMYCALCGVVRVVRIYKCEECDKTWCKECWAKTAEQVRLQWRLNQIEVNNSYARIEEKLMLFSP